MLNPTIRFVPFTAGGETVRFAFDFASIVKCEEVCGVNLFTAIGLSGNTAAQWRGLVWAALLPANPKATLDDAGRIMQAAVVEPGKLTELFAAISATIDHSMPDANPPGPDQAAS